MRRCIAILVVWSFSASFAMAEFINPPGWEDDFYFTHQSWDFLSPANPAAPDGVVPTVSPGAPTATITGGGIWTDAFGVGDGGWLFQGPVTLNTTDPLDQPISFYIPNTPNPNRVKDIWLQATIQTNHAGLSDELVLFAIANGQVYTPGAADLFLMEDLGGGMARITTTISIFPQPPDELIQIGFGLPAIGADLNPAFVFLDDFHIETRCLPEPTAIVSLLGLGLMGFVAWRRRKRAG